jgi:hypothetical protein
MTPGMSMPVKPACRIFQFNHSWVCRSPSATLHYGTSETAPACVRHAILPSTTLKLLPSLTATEIRRRAARCLHFVHSRRLRRLGAVAQRTSSPPKTYVHNKLLSRYLDKPQLSRSNNAHNRKLSRLTSQRSLPGALATRDHRTRRGIPLTPAPTLLGAIHKLVGLFANPVDKHTNLLIAQE